MGNYLYNFIIGLYPPEVVATPPQTISLLDSLFPELQSIIVYYSHPKSFSTLAKFGWLGTKDLDTLAFQACDHIVSRSCTISLDRMIPPPTEVHRQKGYCYYCFFGFICNTFTRSDCHCQYHTGRYNMCMVDILECFYINATEEFKLKNYLLVSKVLSTLSISTVKRAIKRFLVNKEVVAYLGHTTIMESLSDRLQIYKEYPCKKSSCEVLGIACRGKGPPNY